MDGHVYLFLPDPADQRVARDKALQHRESRADEARAGELVTTRGRYVIVQADPPAGPAGRTPAGRPFHRLSRRELQIVVLVAEGCVNKQIADHLKISEWTVSTHLRRIFAKLCVDSRAAMVYRCLGVIGRTGPA